MYIHINGTIYMAKIAAIPIHGKNLQKSSPTELLVPTWHGVS